jgi:hypothetical protein
MGRDIPRLRDGAKGQMQPGIRMRSKPEAGDMEALAALERATILGE